MGQSNIQHVEAFESKNGALQDSQQAQGLTKTDSKTFATATELERSETLDKKGVNFNRVDKEVVQYISDTPIEIDEATNTRLRHMIHWRVLIVMITTYFLQALDKGTMSFTSIMGLREDLHLHGQQFSWLTTCIYLAVLVVEYPTNYIIQRVPIAKYLGINIFLWGATLACHAACTNFAGIVTVRVFLGIFEACCQPSFVILSSLWYKREEQNNAVTYWYMMNGGQQMVGGLLAYCFSLIGRDKVLKSWQAIFIAYGCFTVLFGIFVILWMPDSPMRAKCFSEKDKKLMVERVRENQTGVQNRKFRKEQLIEAFLDPQAYGYCLVQITTTLPTSGLGAFANIIITSFDFTELQTQLLSMVLGAYIIVVLLASAWLVSKTGQNLIVMGCFVIPSFVGTIVLMTVKDHDLASKAGLLVSYYITLSFWSAQTLALSMVSRNIAGQTKKSTVVAMTFVSWAVGNAIGPQVFLERDAPRYFIAFAVHLACYALLVVDIVLLRFYLKAQNKKKDRIQEAQGGVNQAEARAHAFEDLTDKENLHFRYIY